MAEVGRVVSVDGEYVELILKRKEACGKCRACSAGLTEKEMNMRARNLCGAKVGDNVEVFIEQANFMRAVLIMYGIPFIFFMAGIFAGYYGAIYFNIGNEVLISVGLGLALTLISFFLIHLNEKNWSSGRFLPMATRISQEDKAE